MSRFIFLFLICTNFLGSSFLCQAQNGTYSRVKIYTDGAGLGRLAEMGVALDHGDVKKDVYFISDFSAAELEIIRQSGMKYEVQINDVSRYYAEQNLSENLREEPAGRGPCDNSFIKTPSHFRLGTYGGFFTYEDMLSILDSMQLLYPNLISKRAPIDNTVTWEKRPVYWVRISKNPNADQADKPEIFYNALHHAREAVSLSQIIYYMWFLLDNYHTDPEVKGIVDNMEMYFVPCINPDGYIYNQTTNPSGGGMHRKNRRKNSDGTYGVDLNRNYDLYWGYDNQGSSNSTSNDAYRGPSAGSEPETKMIKNFCAQHQFKIAMSCHSFGKYLIHSWGYKANTTTPDQNIFSSYGKFMTQENKYKVGTPSQTVGYTGNGASSDWFYGEQSVKNKIFEFSPEAGSGSFYPAKNQIIPICKDMLESNYKAAKLVLKYVIALDHEPYYINSKTGYLNYQFKSLVPDTMAKFTIRITPVSPVITSVGTQKSYSSIAINSLLSDSISFILNPSVQEGTLLKYVITVSNGAFIHSDTIVKMYGHPVIAFAETGNSINQWISSTGWDLSTSVYHSPSSSITDSPVGKYTHGVSSSIKTKNGIDLTKAKDALLSFWTKWSIESGFDYAQLSASSDSGQTWTPLCGKYTSTGNAQQDVGNPIYDGTEDWVLEQVSLKDFIGKRILLRFSLKTDGQNADDGFYFDDLKVEKIDTIGIPNGLDEITAKLTVSHCMPNPASEYTFVNFMSNKPNSNAVLIVSNALGQTVYSERIEQRSGNIQLSTANWPNGVYYYHLQQGQISSPVHKLCVMH